MLAGCPGEMRQLRTLVLCREADVQYTANILLCGGDNWIFGPLRRGGSRRAVSIRYRSVRTRLERHQPRCRGSVQCFPTCNGRSESGRPADFRFACRSMRLWCASGCACPIEGDRRRSAKPSHQVGVHIGGGDMLAFMAAAGKQPVGIDRWSTLEPSGQRFAR